VPDNGVMRLSESQRADFERLVRANEVGLFMMAVVRKVSP
jgi:hypothetical protein